VELKVPDQFRNATPDSARLARIRESLAASAAPVRRLPSNVILIVSSVAVFLVLTILFAAPAGFQGFARMSVAARLIEYAVILVLAIALAATVVAQMVPGSRHLWSPSLCICLALVILSVAAVFLFPDFGMDGFVHHGIPCLRYGILCAIPAGGLTWVLMRTGFAADPVRAAIAAGGFSGLVGFGALALHCPIFNAAHIVAWHAGAVAVASVAGGVIGWTWSRFRQ
jgi:hypothetical protein